MRSKQWLWFPAVSAAAIFQTAGGTPWVETALTALLALGLLQIPRSENLPGWLEAVRSLWNGIILAQVLHWASGYWQGAPAWAAGTLLLLGVWLAAKGEEAFVTASSVLGLLQLILTGAVLAAALPKVQPENWAWKMPAGNGWLLTVMLLPGLSQERKSLGPGLWALAISLFTTGVLPHSVPRAYYEMSKSLSLLGSIRRMESLAAVGLTLGFLLLSGHLVRSGKNENRLIAAAAAGILFCSPLRIGEMWAAIGSTIIWIILPLFLYLYEKHEESKEKRK